MIMKKIRIVFLKKGAETAETILLSGNIGCSICNGELIVFSADTGENIGSYDLKKYEDISIYDYE